VCFDLLENYAFVWVERRAVNFQQDSLLLRITNSWPPPSPDLSPLDLYFVGYVKDRVHSPNVASLQKIKRNIHRVVM